MIGSGPVQGERFVVGRGRVARIAVPDIGVVFAVQVPYEGTSRDLATLGGVWQYTEACGITVFASVSISRSEFSRKGGKS